jgi:5-hydroxyisourate hydrolase
MITTHVLDTTQGGPAAGLTVILHVRSSSEWTPICRGDTDGNGRLNLNPEGQVLGIGTYRLTFDTGSYYRAQGTIGPFFPEVAVTFTVDDEAEHYHVPLLLSPFGYTTYRGV